MLSFDGVLALRSDRVVAELVFTGRRVELRSPTPIRAMRRLWSLRRLLKSSRAFRDLTRSLHLAAPVGFGCEIRLQSGSLPRVGFTPASGFEEGMSMKLLFTDHLILAAALLSFLFSVSLWFSGMRDEGLFVGIWVPSILSLGAYFRLAASRRNS